MINKFIAFLVIVFPLLLPVHAHAVNVERVISPGGIEAWLVRDQANPVVSMRFLFDGGSELDPVGKEGLANLAASTMDEGAADLDSQAFQQRLTDLAIELRFSAGLDGFSGQVKTLTQNVDEAFGMLHSSMTSPRFDAEPVARLKSQILAGIRGAREKPGPVAYAALFKGLLPDHGYSKRSKGSEYSIENITHADLQNFVRSRLTLQGLKIGVVGDMTPARLGALLDKTFTLPATRTEPLISAVKVQASGRVLHIVQDVVQSTIVFAHGGPRREDADYYAAVVMNHILGGGTFSSRLYTEVRENRGLAYSVSSSLYPLDAAGLIIGSLGTKTETVQEAIEVVRAEWKRMAAGDISQGEVDAAKQFISGSFPLRLTSTGAIARVLVGMQAGNLGMAYLDERESYIQAVTLADVKRVAAKFLKPDALDMVIVGKAIAGKANAGKVIAGKAMGE